MCFVLKIQTYLVSGQITLANYILAILLLAYLISKISLLIDTVCVKNYLIVNTI